MKTLLEFLVKLHITQNNSLSEDILKTIKRLIKENKLVSGRFSKYEGSPAIDIWIPEGMRLDFWGSCVSEKRGHYTGSDKYTKNVNENVKQFIEEMLKGSDTLYISVLGHPDYKEQFNKFFNSLDMIDELNLSNTHADDIIDFKGYNGGFPKAKFLIKSSKDVITLFAKLASL